MFRIEIQERVNYFYTGVFQSKAHYFLLGRIFLFIIFQCTQLCIRTKNKTDKVALIGIWTADLWSGKQWWRPCHSTWHIITFGKPYFCFVLATGEFGNKQFNKVNCTFRLHFTFCKFYFHFDLSLSPNFNQMFQCVKGFQRLLLIKLWCISTGLK